MVRIILGIICITTINYSCKREAGSKVTNREIPNLKNMVTSDSCSFCSMDSFLIKPSLVNAKPEIVIDYPIAIEFFNQAQLIFKYETENYDTLMKVFKMKVWNDRNEIYRLTDQYGYYTQVLKPALLNRGIRTTDSLRNQEFISFADNTTIDLQPYKQVDGVLMYTPGKKPIFWTMKTEQQNCLGLSAVPSWYYSCPQIMIIAEPLKGNITE